MLGISQKRIVKDIQLLNKNKDELITRGIHFHVNETDISKLYLMISPCHKQEGELISPYTGGFFLFEIDFPEDYPIAPPKVIFHPQQNKYRLHPNYYENGKVCLSMINTWSQPDWTATMSMMSLAAVLEERFNERGLSFEPGHEGDSPQKLMEFNNFVRFGVFDVAICSVLERKYPVYEPFQEFIQSKRMECIRLCQDVLDQGIQGIQGNQGSSSGLMSQSSYHHSANINYHKIMLRLQNSS